MTLIMLECSYSKGGLMTGDSRLVGLWILTLLQILEFRLHCLVITMA